MDFGKEFSRKEYDNNVELTTFYTVRTSIDDRTMAKKIAHDLVDDFIASSVHIREIESTYRWQGEIVETQEYEIEVLCMNYMKVIKYIKEMHLYDLPETIVDERKCTTDFAIWIKDNT